MNPERFVVVDECAATIRLAPVMGRAPRNERCEGMVPRNWGHSTTVLAALGQTGIASALVVEGAADSPVFDTFVEQGWRRRCGQGESRSVTISVFTSVLGLASPLKHVGASCGFCRPNRRTSTRLSRHSASSRSRRVGLNNAPATDSGR